MSWYVRKLLLERDSIKSLIRDTYENGSALDLEENQFEFYDFNSDVYMDLLTVEKKLKELIDNGLISSDELRVLEYILSNRTVSQIERDEDISRPTINKKFADICSRVAFHLGGIFTDEGFIYYLTNKYNLKKEQISKLKNHISEEK